jgi:hypothetical protein
MTGREILNQPQKVFLKSPNTKSIVIKHNITSKIIKRIISDFVRGLIKNSILRIINIGIIKTNIAKLSQYNHAGPVSMLPHITFAFIFRPLYILSFFQ